MAEKRIKSALKNPELIPILRDIMAPLFDATADYCIKGSTVIDPKYLSKRVTDYLYGFITSAIYISLVQNGLIEKYSKEDLTETIFISLFGSRNYIFIKDTFPEFATKVSRDGDLDAREIYMKNKSFDNGYTELKMMTLRRYLDFLD